MDQITNSLTRLTDFVTWKHLLGAISQESWIRFPTKGFPIVVTAQVENPPLDVGDV